MIDLKRSIDLRWLFDPVLSFILKWSCFPEVQSREEAEIGLPFILFFCTFHFCRTEQILAVFYDGGVKMEIIFLGNFTQQILYHRRIDLFQSGPDSQRVGRWCEHFGRAGRRCGPPEKWKHEELNKQTRLYLLIKKNKTKIWPTSIPHRVSRWPNTLDAAAVMFWKSINCSNLQLISPITQTQFINTFARIEMQSVNLEDNAMDVSRLATDWLVIAMVHPCKKN